jgi:signal transduction histidine kinase
VEDDGIGFDPAEVTSMATKRAEFGLFSIRERLEQLGGLIKIDSEPGRGSKITMTAPLKDNSLDNGVLK